MGWSLWERGRGWVIWSGSLESKLRERRKELFFMNYLFSLGSSSLFDQGLLYLPTIAIWTIGSFIAGIYFLILTSSFLLLA
jgi:hypothetical protein